MSALNCKPGDLAIVVKSAAGNEGKIVRCVRFIGMVRGFGGSDYWETNTPLDSMLGSRRCLAQDQCLRPIRPLDELDDTTRDEEVAA